MITVKNINGSPEIIPDKYVGVHSDENFFYFFENENELTEHKTNSVKNDNFIIKFFKNLF